MTYVLQTLKRWLRLPLGTAERDEPQKHCDGSHHGTTERDEPQRHGDGSHHDTNSQSRQGAGHDSGLQTRVDSEETSELKAKSVVQEKIERLEGKVAEQNQLLQETLAKLTSVERILNQQVAQKSQAIEDLEEKVAKLDRDLQKKTAALHSMVDKGDGRTANRVEKPEANAAELIQGPQGKIAKLSNAEGAASKRSMIPALIMDFKLEAMKVVVHSPMTPKSVISEYAAGQRDQNIHDSSAMKHKPHYNTEGERTNRPLPHRSDSISIAEVAELVKALNAQLDQTSSLIADSLSYRQSPVVVSNELCDYLGLWLCHDLQRRSNEPDTEPDSLITQIVLQTGLVNACSRIINGWTPPDIGQGVADIRRAQPRSDTSIHDKYLTRISLELINAVGGSLQSGERLPPKYQEKIQDIANRAVGIRRIIKEEVTSSELVTYTIPCGNEFDFSRMEHTEGDGGETGSATNDRVVCTLEMGLQCRKKVEPEKPYGVTTKAKVVLASALEES